MFLIPYTAYAVDNIDSYSIKETMDLEQSKIKLGEDVQFYFGNQSHGTVTQNFGEFSTNKKTNATMKTDKEACQWVFLSAMISLKNRAIKEGGNAVINIKSNYKDNLTISNDTFQCGAGTFVAGVALKGTVVKLDFPI